MSTQHPTIDDPGLGIFSRAETELTDGTVLTHDWYVGQAVSGDSALELMLRGTEPDEIRALLPRLRDVLGELTALRRRASDAVVHSFSDTEPTEAELDDAAADLRLETIEAAPTARSSCTWSTAAASTSPRGIGPPST